MSWLERRVDEIGVLSPTRTVSIKVGACNMDSERVQMMVGREGKRWSGKKMRSEVDDEEVEVIGSG